MTKDEVKEQMLFNTPSIPIFDENKGLRIEAEIDIFNNHIQYQIIDEKEPDVIQFFSYDVNKAIDMYFELLEE